MTDCGERLQNKNTEAILFCVAFGAMYWFVTKNLVETAVAWFTDLKSFPVMELLSLFASFILGAGSVLWLQQLLTHNKIALSTKDERRLMGTTEDSMPVPTSVRTESEDEDEVEEDTDMSYPEPSTNTLHILDNIPHQEHADLFPSTTVMHADVVGFTAWSSVREPRQVFKLLETLYAKFDEIAARSCVFKVETVRDSYVAVCGLPIERDDHAVVMACFANDCIQAMKPLVEELEISLGPDTSDLGLRVGLHSGAVTGGVLREGDRSRFQIFGETVHTALFVERTGLSGRIQVSQETASLLTAAGKEAWLTTRPKKIISKGKGLMQTFWVSLGADKGRDTTAAFADVTHFHVPDDKKARLVEWNVAVLTRLLKQIVARRNLLVEQDPQRQSDANEQAFAAGERPTTVLEEVVELCSLPEYNFSRQAAEQAESLVLDPKVTEQLYNYVSRIADSYNNTPFHNLEHASHVTMSVCKLLSRIVAPPADDQSKDLHDHTYGITSDPLTQFACVLSALMHDADHPGVPNAVLVKEQATVAEHYGNKSVAEQNSVDVCWDMLMDEKYKDLRQSIYTTHSGLQRFRQLIVNSVMATDICDKELKTLRNERWQKAFDPSAEAESIKDARDRKATIVIEHLIQASDVAHTMQHWHIYRKWNQRFFLECYKAYKEGRTDVDPSQSWYEGEIGFFDYYIIPLARKLKDCGVFGVSSHEYLDYAMRNREEWVARGRDVVDEMIALVNSKHGAYTGLDTTSKHSLMAMLYHQHQSRKVPASA